MKDISQTALFQAFNDLVERLKLKGLEKQEMAKLIDVTPPHFSNMLNGSKKIQFSQILKFCDKLGLVFIYDPSSTESVINFSDSPFL